MEEMKWVRCNGCAADDDAERQQDLRNAGNRRLGGRRILGCSGPTYEHSHNG